ncbi:MAG TPA: cytochrome c [Acidimicrobiales bacterium]|nr:cytochrome c [Acidimicrobiales bacterium]
MKRRTFHQFFFGLTLLGLCVGCGDGTDWSTRGPTAEIFPAQVLVRGAAVYGDSCATCHGVDGSGAFGPDLRGKGHKYTYEGHRQIIERGRRSMPGFGASLTEEEIDAVLAHVRVGISEGFNE